MYSDPIIQFVKYGLVGVVATGVDMCIFYLFSWRIIPALQKSDPLFKILSKFIHKEIWIAEVSEIVRGRRFIINSTIAFLFSNLTAYALNIMWVFEAGKHIWYIELLLFYFVSGISICIGMFLGWGMIRMLNLSTSFSYVGKLISAMMINFVCRKYIIF